MAGNRSEMIGEFDPTNFLRNEKVFFHSEKFNSFWNDRLNSGTYMVELVKYIIECLKSRKVIGVSIEQGISTLNMLMYVEYFYDHEERFHESLKEASKKWNILEDNSSHKYLHKIITLALRVFKRKEDLLPDLVNCALSFPNPIKNFANIRYKSYMGNIYTVNYPSDLQTNLGLGSIYLSANSKFCRLDCGEFCLHYSFIKKQLQNSNMMTVAATINIKFHEILVNVYNKEGKKAERMLLPLLHMFKQLFILYPDLLSDHLDAYILELDKIRRWPLPYGSSANNVLALLVQELKSTGITRLKKIRQEFPIIDKCLPLNEIREFDYPANVYCVLETEDSENALFTKLVYVKDRSKKMFFKDITRLYPGNLNEVSLLAHILRLQVLRYELSIYNDFKLQEVSALADQSVEVVFSLYTRILEIIETCNQSDTDTARFFKENYTFEFLVSLETLNTSESNNELTQILFKYLSQFNSNDIKVPPLNYEVVSLSNDVTITEPDQTARIEESVLLGKQNLPMSGIFAKHLDEDSPAFNTRVRVIVIGSDKNLHEYVKNYVDFVQLDPRILSLDTRVYVIPTFGVPSTMAEYLYSIDSWYQRHVYIPFAERPWLPKLDSASAKHNKRDPHQREQARRSMFMGSTQGGLSSHTYPLVVSSDLLDDFVWEADHFVNVNVYAVRCWRQRPDSSPPDYVIPMTMYLECGSHVNKATTGGLECIIKAAQMDPFGVEYAEVETVNKRIHRMIISNVPREKDTSTPAIPSAEWLELSYIEADSAGHEEKFVKKRKGKKGNETQANINVAISTLYSCLHVGGIEITLAGVNQQMNLLVDGVYYGPFNSFSIEPWTFDDGKILSIQVATFLEIES